MASNTQIVANIHRNKRPKRIWIGILFAILLVTVPVLPLKFLGIPGPDLDWQHVEDMSRALIGKFTTGSQQSAESPSATNANKIVGSDIKLIDTTLKSLLNELTMRPSDPSLHNQLGLIYAELGEPHSAITHFEESISLSRTKIKDLTTVSNAAREKGDDKLATARMLEVSALNVQLAAAHSSLARVYEQLGKSGKMMAQLNELSKDISLTKAINPAAVSTASVTGTVGGTSKLDANTAEMLAHADALRISGQYVEAQQTYKRLIEKVPNLALAHKELGMTALAMHNVWLAQEELTKAAELGSKDATVFSALGNISKDLGQFDSAIKSYEKALAINPKEINAAFNLGTLYADDNQYDKAIVSFKKAISERPDFALAHNNLATMYSFTGQYPQAIREFHQAISLSPSMASAYYGIGIAYMHEKHYRDSVRAFKRALALNPDLIDAHNKLEQAQKLAMSSGRIN